MAPSIQAFFVQIANPNGVCFAGTPLKGRLVLVLKKPTKLRSLRLHFHGQANTHWTTSSGSGKSRRTRHHYGREMYLDQVIPLWGNPVVGEQVMAAGSHEFPFSLVTAPTCPTSFEGGIGHIRYHVMGIIDKGSFSFDEKVIHPFTVIGLQDLNMDAYAQQPSMFQKTKPLGSLCCAAGNISVDMRQPYKGFVPGQSIKLDATIANESKRIIRKIAVTLDQNITFIADGNRTRASSRVVATVGRMGPEHEIAPYTTREVKFHDLIVPAVPPMLLGCRIINIMYMVHLRVTPKGPHTDLDVLAPIIIGTIPLKQSFNELRQLKPTAPLRQEIEDDGKYQPGQRHEEKRRNKKTKNSGDGAAEDNGEEFADMPDADKYPDMPAPHFEESCFGQTNISDSLNGQKNVQGAMGFAPVYPVYGDAEIQKAPDQPGEHESSARNNQVAAYEPGDNEAEDKL